VIEGLYSIWMETAMRAAESIVFERPSWIQDVDWQAIVARLRAVVAEEEQRIDRERCAEAIRARPVAVEADA
jgi:hypothetical protein